MIKAEYIDKQKTEVSMIGSGLQLSNELEAIIGTCGKNPALLKLLEIAIDKVSKNEEN